MPFYLKVHGILFLCVINLLALRSMPYESDAEFRQRIILAVRDAEEGGNTGTGNDPKWMLGARNHHRGSLHSDIWIGLAEDIASRGMLAVFPVNG